MGKVSRDLSTEENRRFWQSVENTAEEVRAWPAWKRGEHSLPFLNWYAKNKKRILGLETALNKGTNFRTIRLGPKYADNLNPGQLISITIGDRADKPNIIGEAMVVKVSKVMFANLVDGDLAENIGAKNINEALKDISKVYGKDPFAVKLSVVSMIDLKAQ